MTEKYTWSWRGGPMEVGALEPSAVVESAVGMPVEDFWMSHPTWSDIPLFHYTSADGFLGILGSGEIWASDARCLNDESELDYARRLMASSLDDLLARGDYPVVVQQYVDALRRGFERLPSVYVACFSEAGDQLGQWRGYAQVSGGYSLGFDPFPLPPGLRIMKVEYRPERQRAQIDRTIDVVADVLTWASDKVPPEELERLSRLCLDVSAPQISAALLRCKDPSFDQELEWRVCYLPEEADESSALEVHFRPTAMGAVPYVKIPVEGHPRPLREVITAPGADADVRQAMTAVAIKAFGSERTVVRASRIPLRY